MQFNSSFLQLKSVPDGSRRDHWVLCVRFLILVEGILDQNYLRMHSNDPYYEEEICKASQRSRGGRVVKALDSKSNGVSPRRFESCPRRYVLTLKANWLSKPARPYASRHLWHNSWPITCSCLFWMHMDLFSFVFRLKSFPDGNRRDRWVHCIRIAILVEGILDQIDPRKYSNEP